MADKYELIPEEKRPYRWAYMEMMLILQQSKGKDKPKHIRLMIDKLLIPVDMHISLFHPTDPGMPDIYRTYWYSTSSVSYSILSNYYELREQHPEFITLLENCGRNAYERAQSNFLKAIKKGIMIPDYPPLSLYEKKTEA